MYSILSPPRIEMGAGSIVTLKDITNVHARSGKVLVVTDEGIREAGILDRVIRAMGKDTAHIDVFDRVRPNPDIATAEACGRAVASGAYSMVIGVGGGSPMDVAKAGAILPTNGGEITPLLGRDTIKKPGVTLCLVPTTSGTGSEVTQALVIYDSEAKTKKAIWDAHLIPSVAVIDPELTVGMPARLSVDTGLDALVHGIEAFASTGSNPFVRVLARECIRLVAAYLPRVLGNGRDLEGRSAMSLAATFGGLAFSNGGLGAIHALSYPLDTDKRMPHGRATAVLAPWIMDYNRIGNEATYAEIARYLGEDVDRLDVETASERSVDRMMRLMESVGVSPYLSRHGILLSEVDRLAREAFRGARRLLRFNPRAMTEEDAVRIYREAARA